MSSSRKTKLGKTRLDKFYHLAKEQGYRSRAAFKLIQLNKKYDLLSSSKAILDLCAAPGSWMQVASKYMPLSSLLVGVDLDPIKPIPHATMIQGDITTQKCRADIKKALTTHKVDLVLHDGAPNVGAAWTQDAYSQSELVLHSLKLATEFLVSGGNFVTKVFRSADYNSLLFVFNQLFKKVEATKPPASRNTSAEIFVVCQGYLDPQKIDPKMLDPKYVFKDLDEVAAPINVFAAKQPRRNRSGYDEDNPTLFKQMTVMDFLMEEEPVMALGKFNKIVFNDEAKPYADHPATTGEIRSVCEDLRVCGKGDLKELLRWRLKMLSYKDHLEGKRPAPEVVEKEESSSEEELTEEQRDQKLTDDLVAYRAKLMKQKKREKRKLLMKKAKKQRLVDQGAYINESSEAFFDDTATDMFKLSSIKGGDDVLNEIVDVEAPDIDPEEIAKEDGPPTEAILLDETIFESSDSEEDSTAKSLRRMDEDFERMYQEKLEESKSKAAKRQLAKLSYRKRKEEELDKLVGRYVTQGRTQSEALSLAKSERQESKFIPKVNSMFDSDEEEAMDALSKRPKVESESDEEDYHKAPNSLVIKDEEAAPTVKKMTNMWFSQPIFGGLSGSTSATSKGSSSTTTDIGQKRKRPAFDDSDDDGYNSEEEIKKMQSSQKKADDAKAKRDDKIAKKKKSKQEESDSSSSDDDKGRDSKSGAKKKGGAFEEVPKNDVIEDLSDMDDDEKATALAIGTYIVNNRAAVREMEDNAYNRYAFVDDEMPHWFKDEEREHHVPQMPITKAEVEEMKKQSKALDARPIKKIAEARARKKMKAVKAMDAIKARALLIADANELTPGQKTKAIEELYKTSKFTSKPALEKKYVVMRGFMKGKVAPGQREKGKRVVRVDPRLKKDKRNASFRAKKK